MAAPPPPPSTTKWAPKKIVSESESYVKLNPLPQPKVIPIDNFDWSSVSRMQVSGDGSSGVLFTHNKDGTAVLKASQGEGEHFANLLMKRCGITTPYTKVITRQHKAWHMIEEIKNNKDLRFAILDLSSRRRLDGMARYQQFHLIQLIEGKALHSLDNPEQWFIINGKEESTHVLFKMGGVSAVDCIINNWDRLPSFWKNQGNGGNIMISNEGDVVAIDQLVSTILIESEEIKHFQNMSDFLDQFLFTSETVNSVPRPFEFTLGDDVASIIDPGHRLRAFFLNTTGVDIGDEGVLLIRKGFTSMAKKVAMIDTKDIEDLYNETWKEICEGFTEVVGMADPKDVGFIMKGILLFRKKLSLD